MSARELVASLAARAFPRALARYSPYLLLGEPVVDPEGDTFARIDLASRTIRLGARPITEASLEDALEALIAHEIGHHVAFPGNPVEHARLLLLERTFLPRLPRSLMGPFYDLLVDERLGRGLPSIEDDLCRILVARGARSPDDVLFTFQRAVIEELWQRREGELLGTNAAAFERAFPDHRLDAKLVAENLFAFAPDVTLQYLYFASIAWRYAMASPAPKHAGEGDCAEGDPSAEDLAAALVPKKGEKAAIERAIREGFFPKDLAEKLADQSLERRAGAMPGDGAGKSELLTTAMAAHYRREAEKYLFRPPPARVFADALVPTTHLEWEPGDPVADIDWVATLLRRGETLGAAMPLLRERIADEEGQSTPSFLGRTEIYLDVSGSMPDPKRALNAMTLAAQILATGTIRAGGAARALVYSVGHEKAWDFCRSERVLSKFLMRYIGGGTQFPFDVLAASVEETRSEQPIRVIITDSDFDANYDAHRQNAGIFARAAERSPAFVLLLHAPNREKVRRYEQAGARVVTVRALLDFPRVAAELAFSLFDDPGKTNPSG
ncbi:hypothetical protein [Polyangium sp. y55x31]|uniref:hypothetical protein n=1 Tax=Polyangium sp. y55x31 TaxID=3042688 RepID=UPI00248315B4|nr:hypothetical protein [Polyangium sp. y55x31]MDI1482497.1 hypothetical protein [Polyangium sp. y55x31]